MKRLASSLFVCFYLTALGYGVVCHAFSTGNVQHPVMYYLVWDMFCGWDSYANKFHVVGEGESGQYYELAPGPWGDIHPYGNLGRQNYDSHLAHLYRMALNSLKHSSHEPMVKIHVIEELWSKKFDFPEYLWNRKYEVPREPLSYFHRRLEYEPDGELAVQNTSWFENQVARTVNVSRAIAGRTQSRPSFFFGPGASAQNVPESVSGN